MPVDIIFQDRLSFFLSSRKTKNNHHVVELHRKTSIKDFIESFGIPHTEIAQILVNNIGVAFDYPVQTNDEIRVMPTLPPFDVFTPSLLRPEPLATLHFIADINVARLARFMRMLGFDTICRHNLNDKEIADIAAAEKRVVLTRDRRLLMRKKIAYGHYVMAVRVKDQLTEIIAYFALADKLKPYSRCMQCNGLLRPVQKEKIIDRLQPLTRKYYDTFHICVECGKLYWNGSHKEKMEKLLREIVNF